MVQRTRPAAAPCALAWLLLASPSRAAVAASDLISYVGGAATGQTLSTVSYTMTVVANSTDALVSLSFDGAMSEVGWLGWGMGEAMSGADFVVLWPNSDSTWTLSHRTSLSTTMPTLTDTATPASVGTDASGSLLVVAGLSSSAQTDSPCVVTFSRPLAMPTTYTTTADHRDLAAAINQPIVYAYGGTNPGKSDPASDFEQHDLDKMGATFVDLSASFTADTAAISAPLTSQTGGGGVATTKAGTGGTGATTTTGGTGGNTGTGTTEGGTSATATKSADATEAGSSNVASQTGTKTIPSTTSPAASSSSTSTSGLTYSNVILYHAICGAAAWLVVAPTGVLIARLGRHCLFFPWHWGVQVFLTTVLTMSAVGLAFYSVNLKGGKTVWDTHTIVGLGILAALCTQDFIGLWIHLSGKAATPAEKKQGRPLKNWGHILLGISLLTAGFVQVKLGMTKYGVANQTILYGYWAPIGIFTVVYLISAFMAIANPAPPPASPMRHKKHHKGHHHHKAKKHNHPRRGRRKVKHHKKRRRRSSESLMRRRSHSDSDDDQSGSSGNESSRSSSGSGGGSSSGSGSESSSDEGRRGRRK